MFGPCLVCASEALLYHLHSQRHSKLHEIYLCASATLNTLEPFKKWALFQTTAFLRLTPKFSTMVMSGRGPMQTPLLQSLQMLLHVKTKESLIASALPQGARKIAQIVARQGPKQFHSGPKTAGDAGPVRRADDRGGDERIFSCLWMTFEQFGSRGSEVGSAGTRGETSVQLGDFANLAMC